MTSRASGRSSEVFCWPDQHLCVNLLCATFPTVERLAEGEILAAEVPHVVFFKSSADHLGCVVLTGQLGMKQGRWGGGQKVASQGCGRTGRRPHQDALVDVPVADALHTDPDDAGVIDLLVVDGQRGLRRAAGGRPFRWRRGFRVRNRRRAEVRV